MNKIFICQICGEIVEILKEGTGIINCCNKQMKELIPIRKEDEIHKIIIENNRVKIGHKEHPMEEKHHIVWIEATDGKEITKIFLKQNQKPIAEFSFEPISARAYCNIDGLIFSD